MRALIIEESEARRVLLEKMLAPHCAVESARNAKEGLRKFIVSYQSADPFAIVCTADALSGMGGNDLVKQIRRLEKYWPDEKVSPRTVFCVFRDRAGEDRVALEFLGDQFTFHNATQFNKVGLLSAIGFSRGVWSSFRTLSARAAASARGQAEVRWWQ
ncbi:response regulator [Geomonas terrae]|uniref:Response regulator n=1 Tax=Geomonas terrae TaxID=2562681 RepID=A0A4S1CLX4_9BACT|nr:response regulator [Geomonas terrae]TGU74236.1 response regulator [Geomonas terrae]